ncbi:endolytic transglycosylase MltG [Kingella kingae]|uniref:endolytic transglycosylase MltG n=1 Tax=Kingella kingae TaxID=504 RepID=UPI0004107551|nr:endolytic transglycosylase MltG [Kingella kingae]MDK4576966.1 endolytic transglycosylase MltG [Kingella kingae]MDK4582207.1 endolytic transglycosylase MltG [Kingella kingae]MDK4593210.1 endolytic transglycosylase MltG [Kingella kingae]MDK4594409.1 endolytic transglycosylase MltG [Kingella kingae]MDK4634553.1 endolytic transglycosylase MltG [Kingella kingae]
MKPPFKLRWLLLAMVLLAALPFVLMFVPKNNGDAYRLVIEKGQGMSAVSQKLAQENQIFSRHVLLLAAYLNGSQHQLMAGSYRLPAQLSAWDLVQKLREQRPDTVRVQILEGMRFAQMRRIINQTQNIRHDTLNLSDEALLQKIAPDAPSSNPEGLFFPDSYEIDANASDIQLFEFAYKNMQRELQAAWDKRDTSLPYKTPYELLIMASLIEKETAHEEDRRDVAAVFRNRLAIGMRLQTDPTVIYGMGDAYQGKIRRADLQRDTPYNTYTRNGLTPTPIALPSRAALDAAANPSSSKYLYFVSRMDGTGKSQFSHTLDEHNAAVRQYILKK